MLPESGKLSKDQRESAAQRLHAYIVEKRGFEPREIARHLGIPIKSAEMILVNRVFTRDDVDRHIRKMMRWCVQQEDADGSQLGRTYVTTTVAEQMFSVMRGVNEQRMMGAIVGPSGVSKSTVCRAVEAGLIPGSVHIELTQAHGRPATLAHLIARKTGVSRSRHSLAVTMEMLIDTLTGTDRLMMVDEAHYLTPKGCQVLRDLHKQTGCPVVLVGTRDVLETINDFSEFAGQFKRLFAYVYDITAEQAATGDPLYTHQEISRFATSIGIRLTGDGLDLAADVTNLLGWGGLGSLGALLLNAQAMARATEAKSGNSVPFNAKLLRAALRNMEGATGFDRVTVRARRHSTGRVAVA